MKGNLKEENEHLVPEVFHAFGLGNDKAGLGGEMKISQGSLGE